MHTDTIENKSRAGSALVIVMGLLAVIMLMAVAFSNFMRLERSGTTNIRHSISARHSTITALNRVLLAVDETFTFDNDRNNFDIMPTTNRQVHGWTMFDDDGKLVRAPYIVSRSPERDRITGNPNGGFLMNKSELVADSTATPKYDDTKFWDSVAISDVTKRGAAAKIVTEEMSRYLSPTQKALLRGADVEWVHIRAGASESTSSPASNSIYDPSEDMLIARYAFIVFDNTGLLDMNGFFDPYDSFYAAKPDKIPPNPNLVAPTDFGQYLRSYDSSATFTRGRNAAGGFFTSYENMLRKLHIRESDITNPGKSLYNYWTGGDISVRNSDLLLNPYNPSEAQKTLFSRDLFTHLGMTADDLDPNHEMKLLVSTNFFGVPMSNPYDAQIKNYAQMALRKFNKVFQQETDGNGGIPISLAGGNLDDLGFDKDDYGNIQGIKCVPLANRTSSPFLPPLTRAQLATQSLIDRTKRGLGYPGAFSSGGIWATCSHNECKNPLNYPVTANIPMINSSFAQFMTHPPTDNEVDDIGKPVADWGRYIQYEIDLDISVKTTAAALPLPQINGSDESFTLEASAQIQGFFDKFIENMFFDPNFYSINDRVLYFKGDGVLFSKDEHVAGKGFGINVNLSPDNGVNIKKFSDRKLEMASGPGIGPFTSRSKSTLIVRAKVDPAFAAFDPDGNLLNYIDGNGTPVQTPTFFAMTYLEQINPGQTVEVPLMVSVDAKVKNSNNQIVHQVPAPALMALCNPQPDNPPVHGGQINFFNRDFRVKVHPTLTTKTPAPGTHLPVESPLAWAMAIDPRFAYNTLAMTTQCSFYNGDLEAKDIYEYLPTYISGEIIHWLNNATCNIKANNKLGWPGNDWGALFVHLLEQKMGTEYGINGASVVAAVKNHSAYKLFGEKALELSDQSQDIAGSLGSQYEIGLLYHMFPTSGTDPNMTQLKAREISEFLTQDARPGNINPATDTVKKYKPIYPDIYHTAALPRSATESMSGADNQENWFLPKGAAAMNRASNFQPRAPNKPMTSIADFGDFLIGPWETLSLFATYGPGGVQERNRAGQFNAHKTDFHRVADYFTLDAARYPDENDLSELYRGNIPRDENSTMPRLNDFPYEYLPGMRSAKLNLNPQQLVRLAQYNFQDGKKYDFRGGAGMPVMNGYNHDPLALLISSIPYDNSNYSYLTFDQSRDIAGDIYGEFGVKDDKTIINARNLLIANISSVAYPTYHESANPNFPDTTRPWNANAIYRNLPTNARNSDQDRERLVGRLMDQLTTRGQSYTIVLRSDAYSPKFGTDLLDEGTTLATEYAIIEAWRDSEPVRIPGSTPNLSNRRPGPPGNIINWDYYQRDKSYRTPPETRKYESVIHNWHIKSIRVFNR